mgnify:CR=1 FL=1
MATQTTYLVQAFVMKRGGVIAPGKQEASPSESGAIKRAEAWAAREIGCAALRIVADDETGEVSEATILAQHGRVPEDFADQIKGG